MGLRSNELRLAVSSTSPATCQVTLGPLSYLGRCQKAQPGLRKAFQARTKWSAELESYSPHTSCTSPAAVRPTHPNHAHLRHTKPTSHTVVIPIRPTRNLVLRTILRLHQGSPSAGKRRELLSSVCVHDRAAMSTMH